MEMRELGRTGLKVSRLGVGLAEMGHLSLAEAETAGRLLHAALDGGINFLDTAACYGNSEELIGKTLAERRDEYVLATKAGHVTGGYQGQAWTAETIRDSIGRSLARLKTDCVDLVQLHSCDVAILERGEVIQALLDAKQAGKTRFIGYSGDGEAARWAIESGHFDTLQISFNLLDQEPRRELLPMAQERGMGVIVKRPIANAVWGANAGSGRQTYRERAGQMADMGPIPGAPENSIALALGFTLAHDEVDTAIVGTRNPEHMKSNLALVENTLPLPDQVVEELHRRFDQVVHE
jgi:aryl-alcohol dehydrogenase-like predicted oxidoreductase